jgi:hypothetical protein
MKDAESILVTLLVRMFRMAKSKTQAGDLLCALSGYQAQS